MDANASSKLDLLQSGCSYLELSGTLNTPIEGVEPLLPEGRAVAIYRRSKTVHCMLLSFRDQDSFRFLWITPPDPDDRPVLPSKRGDPWRALDLIYEAADIVDVECHFEIPTTEMKPLLRLPLLLVEDGPFVFNQIQGYRAARVEGDKTVWTAVLDRAGNTGGYHLLVQFDDHQVGDDSPRDLFQRCVVVKEGLFWGAGSDD